MTPISASSCQRLSAQWRQLKKGSFSSYIERGKLHFTMQYKWSLNINVWSASGSNSSLFHHISCFSTLTIRVSFLYVHLPSCVHFTSEIAIFGRLYALALIRSLTKSCCGCEVKWFLGEEIRRIFCRSTQWESPTYHAWWRPSLICFQIILEKIFRYSLQELISSSKIL